MGLLGTYKIIIKKRKKYYSQYYNLNCEFTEIKINHKKNTKYFF